LLRCAIALVRTPKLERLKTPPIFPDRHPSLAGADTAGFLTGIQRDSPKSRII